MSAKSGKVPVTRPFSAFSRFRPHADRREHEKVPTQCAILRYTAARENDLVGEFIDPIGSMSSMSLFSSLIGAAALGVYALWQDDSQNNDDDDSSPGGGLMQPVA